MIRCEIITTVIEVEGRTERVYGLDFYKNEEIIPFKTVKDIFVELKMAESLKEVINKNDISEIHIDDVIDDNLF